MSLVLMSFGIVTWYVSFFYVQYNFHQLLECVPTFLDNNSSSHSMKHIKGFQVELTNQLHHVLDLKKKKEDLSLYQLRCPKWVFALDWYKKTSYKFYLCKTYILIGIWFRIGIFNATAYQFTTFEFWMLLDGTSGMQITMKKTGEP